MLGVVTKFRDEAGELVSKGSGRVVLFVRAVCSAEPKQGSLVKFDAERQKRGPAIATAVEVLDTGAK